MLNKFMEKLKILNTKDDWHGSAYYWNSRYKMGGSSGAGSYNHLATFKANILNEFVKNNNIKRVIEWGCGDGNQLMLAEYPEYIGFDVSEEAIKICKKKFRKDNTKKFICNGQENFRNNELKADLSISLDVLYHLVEDNVFDIYMKDLFASSDNYVIIYSCNFDKYHEAHVRCRKFTIWIEENIGDKWELINIIKNKYPYDENNASNTSWSDFYIYKKRIVH